MENGRRMMKINFPFSISYFPLSLISFSAGVSEAFCLPARLPLHLRLAAFLAAFPAFPAFAVAKAFRQKILYEKCRKSFFPFPSIFRRCQFRLRFFQSEFQ
jgi:hypothetical protein